MATSDVPDPVEKRDIVFDKDTPEETLRETGDQFFEANQLVDAIDAYEQGDIKEGGKKILDVAVEDGNYFLVHRVANNWPDLVDDELWKEAGKNAEDAGRYTDAVKLYFAGGHEEDVNRTEEKLEEDFGHSVPAVVRRDMADAKEKEELDD